MDTSNFVTGNPIDETTAGVDRSVILTIDNCMNSSWVFSPNSTGEALYLVHEALRPDALMEWRFSLVDAHAQTYHIQNVKNSNYAWVSKDNNAIGAGTLVLLSETPRDWKLTHQSNGRYRIYPDGNNSYCWTAVSDGFTSYPVVKLEGGSSDSGAWHFQKVY